MDIVTGAMGVLPAKVLELVIDEFDLQTSVKGKVKDLSDELKSMHVALSMVALVPPEKLDARAKLWARDFREASYDMEDILDTFLVRVDGAPKPAILCWFQRLLTKMAELFCLDKVMARHEIATAILDFIKQLKDMDERHGRCRVDHLVPSIPAAAEASVDPRIADFYRADLVGIDKPRDAVIAMLDDESSKNTKMKVVSIFGSGGLGKTTLAKAVYDKANTPFDCWAFVSVGQNPDQRKVLRDILIDLFDNEKRKQKTTDRDKKRYNITELTEFDAWQLIKQLRQFLEEQRYLIVLDDIWDIDTWDVILKPAFPESNHGSRIIATTRISDVAEAIGKLYEIQQLSDDCSRKLLSKIIFGREDELENDEVAEKIIRKCQGVPLAITAIASLLAPPKQRHEWSSLCESIFSNSFSSEHDKNPQVNNVMKILSFSYYHLPCHLRACMLYLSAFPEDEYVDKNMLIWRWIAEGLVREEEGKGLFEVGDSYFRELINRGLIQPLKDYGGILDGCRVHDFVLRLIRKLSREENFVCLVDSQQRSLSLAQGKVRRLTLHKIWDTEDDSRRVREDHTDMSAARVEEGYLKLIGKLRHLRYLGLIGPNILELPEEVGRLEFLQALVLERTRIEELPKSLEQLTQLMCLRAGKKTRVPDWIGKLTSLVELMIYPGAESRSFVKELGKLTDLRVLNTDTILQDEEHARDLLESLSNLQKIEIIEMPTMFGYKLKKGTFVEQSLVLCRNLRKLDICVFFFPRLPKSIDAEALPNLCSMTISLRQLSQQDMEIFGKFQKLRRLYLCVRTEISQRISISGGDGFQNLKSFHALFNPPVLLKQGAMPSLEFIEFWINTCSVNIDNLDLDSGLGNLNSLQQCFAIITCAGCSLTEVEEAEDMVRQAVLIHPNRPTLKISRTSEDEMVSSSSGLLAEDDDGTDNSDDDGTDNSDE